MKKTSVIAFVTFLLVASMASAQHRGGGPGGGPGEERGPGGQAIVGADGTLYLETSTGITAIRSTGAAAWTATVDARGFVLSGGNLIAATRTEASDGTVSTTLTALSTSSGAVAWTRTIAGNAGELRPFSGGTYVFVVVPPTASGGTATRSLVAIGNDGSVLWTLALS